MKKTPMTRAEILAVLLVALAFSALCAVAMNAYLNRDNRWFRVVSPEGEKAVELVAVSRLLQPYVRTQEGHFFFCSGRTWRDRCEQITEEELPVNRVPPRWLTCPPDLPELPQLPGVMVHSLAVAQCQEGKTYAKIMILEDGSIWHWQRSYSWVNNFALGTVILYSFIFGAAAGLASVQLRRYLRSSPPHPDSRATMR